MTGVVLPPTRRGQHPWRYRFSDELPDYRVRGLCFRRDLRPVPAWPRKESEPLNISDGSLFRLPQTL